MTLLNDADAIYLGALEADRVYLGGELVWEPPVAPPGPSSSILVSYTPGSNRNDFSGQVGVRLGISPSPLAVAWIGARSNGYGGTRTVKLYEWFADALVRTAVIDYTGKAAGQFAWTAVSPVTLAANGYYALMMDVVASDGNWWANPGVTAFTGAIVNVYDVYRIGAGALQTGSANSQFIGLDLGMT